MMDLYITLICDYGQNDLAFIECYNEFLYQFSENIQSEKKPRLFLNTISTQAFNTIQNGFFVGQIANNSKLSSPHAIHLVFHNCAPRKDKKEERISNDGEGLACAVLKNGSIVIGVNSGHSFSFIEEDVFLLNCETKGSQFRSRDIFPKYIKEVFDQCVFSSDKTSLSNLGSFCKEKVVKPTVPRNTILHVDGYGNIKNNLDLTSMEDGTMINIKIKGVERRCIVSKKGIFSVKDGELVLSYGSSGWGGKFFPEIVLRGGSASNLFGFASPSDLIEVS